jgi:transposase
MIQFTTHMRLLVATTPIDMRKGIDGIAVLCKSVLMENPMSGAVFLFKSRRGKHIRILTYDGQGYWICTKRLSAGKFPFWPLKVGSGLVSQLEACEAQVLIHGGDPWKIRQLPFWKKIEPTRFAVGI